MKRKTVYTADLPQKLYLFFHTYDGDGAPSFTKFAEQNGMTVADVESCRTHEEFERAYMACREIRRDYLIDNALSKRCDASLVRFLLATEFGMGEETTEEKDDRTLSVILTVVP